MVDPNYKGKVAKPVLNLDIQNTTPLYALKRRHSRVQPPSHSGPPSQSLVITTHIPPITVDYNGRKAQYTRHQIAKDLHLSASYISIVFSGKRKLSMQLALRLSKYFDVSLDYLVNDLMPRSIYLLRESVNEQRNEIISKL